MQRKPLVVLVFWLSLVGIAVPASAEPITVTVTLGSIQNNQWALLPGAASGGVLIRVVVTPPPGKYLTGAGCSLLRVEDKRGWHEFPLSGGTPIPDGPGVAYTWLSHSGTNGDVTPEIHGSASWMGPPPNRSGSADFVETITAEVQNVTVSAVTSSSDLCALGLTASTPDDPIHEAIGVFADAPDPNWEVSDKGTATISLQSIGPDGLLGSAWTKSDQDVDMSSGYSLSDSYKGPPVCPRSTLRAQVRRSSTRTVMVGTRPTSA